MDQEFKPQFQKHLDNLEAFKEIAYLPEVQKSPNVSCSNSKFGGYPYLSSEDNWEKCPSCSQPMLFLFQLNLATLPINSTNALVQVFYCEEEWVPAIKKVKVQSTLVDSDFLDHPENIRIFPQQSIKEWRAVVDYPHTEDYWDLALEIPIDEVYEIMEFEHQGEVLFKDKLFGWPAWEQEPNYPITKKTNQPMKLLFQLVSDEILPFSFGDGGILSLFYDSDFNIKTNLDYG